MKSLPSVRIQLEVDASEGAGAALGERVLRNAARAGVALDEDAALAGFLAQQGGVGPLPPQAAVALAGVVQFVAELLATRTGDPANGT